MCRSQSPGANSPYRTSGAVTITTGTIEDVVAQFYASGLSPLIVSPRLDPFLEPCLTRGANSIKLISNRIPPVCLFEDVDTTIVCK